MDDFQQRQEAGETPQVQVQLPVDVRSMALAVLAFCAVVAGLHWAKEVLIPITLAVAASYALMPVVTWLKLRARVPPALGAALALSVCVGAIVLGGNVLAPEASRLLDAVPKATKNLEHVLSRTALSRTSTIRKASEAAGELEKVANSVGSGGQPPADNADITGASPINLRDYVWAGTAATVRALGTAVIVLALIYFLLISGHSFKRKLVKISGDTLRQKKITLQIIDEIDSQIQRYMLIQVVTSALLGLLTGIAFALLGLENAAFWGVAAGVLHLIPYVGPSVIVIASAVFAYLQFEDLERVLLVAGSALAIAGAVGLGVVPWLTGRIGRINAVATFVTLLFWEWLWGVPGLLLGIPIMMAVMAVCERIDNLVPIAELLASDERKTRPVSAA